MRTTLVMIAQGWESNYNLIDPVFYNVIIYKHSSAQFPINVSFSLIHAFE